MNLGKKRSSRQSQTSFDDKCRILVEVWASHRNNPRLADFVHQNDIGLPLACLILTRKVKVTRESEDLIDESFASLLDEFSLSDSGYESLEEILPSEDSATDDQGRFPGGSHANSIRNGAIFGFDNWAKEFQPIKNHLSESSDKFLFETFGEQLDWPVLEHPNRVWTYLTRGKKFLIVPGHLVEEGRIGHYVTQVPWIDEDLYCVRSIEEDCTCFNQASEPDPNCETCSGTGVIFEDFD